MKKKIIFPAVIAVITFLLYYNSLSNSFAYDDKVAILQNNHLPYFTGNISSFFNKKYFNISEENSYRPVTTLTYFINYQIWKLNPFGYHLASLLLHIVCVLLLYLLLNKLFKNNILSFVICLIYLSHPILTEAVDCITFNDDLLVSIFFILSFLLYLKSSEKNKYQFLLYLLSLLCFLISMLSKESGFMLLPMIFFYDFFIAENTSDKKIKTGKSDLKSVFDKILIKWKEKFYLYLGYLWFSIFFLILSFVIFKSPNKPADYLHNDFFTRLIYLPYNLFQFIKISVLPLNLINDYIFSYPDKFFSLNNIISYLIAAGLIILSCFAYKFSKKIFFGFWWFIITLIPALNIIEILNPIAERYLYLPLIGFSIITGTLILELPDKFKKLNDTFRNGIKAFIVIVLFSTYSYLTFQRNFIWKDDISLSLDVIKKTPGNYNAYYGLGYECFSRGLYDDSEKYFKKAIELKPDYSLAFNALGNIYLNKKMYDKAIIEFQNAINADPHDNISYYNLGNILKDKGDLQGAIKMYQKSININPNFYGAYYNLGNVYASEEMYPEAINQYKTAININFNVSEIHFNLAMSYLKLNDADNALNEFLIVIKLKPDEVEAFSMIGEIYTISHDYDKAEKYLLKGIQINPDYPETYFNLGMVYAIQDKLEDAIAQWENTVRLDPNNTGAKENIKLAKKMMKK